MLSSVTNIFLDLLFVIRFGMGVPGRGVGDPSSRRRSPPCWRFSCCCAASGGCRARGKPRVFECERLRHICRVAVPSIIQQSIVSFGALFVQALVNGYGSDVIAGYTAATKIDSIAIMPMLNVGNAVSSFTAQNIGAAKPGRVGKGLRAAVVMSAVIGGATTAVLWGFGPQFVGLFVDSSANAAVIAAGVEYLTVVSLFYAVMGIMCDFNGVLRGAGDMKVFMIGTLGNFSARVVLAYTLAAFIGRPPSGGRSRWLDDRPRHRGRPVLSAAGKSEIHH